MLGRQAVTIGALISLLAVACAAPAAAPAPPTAPAAPPSPAPAGAASPLPERQTIKYGYNPILSGAPVFIAQERGYFAEQGLEMEFTPFDSAALMVAPLSAGQLDAIPAVPSPSLFNALVREITMKAVAAQSWSGTMLMVRKELVDSGQVRSLADLRGKRVSFNVEGSPVDYTLRNAFYKQGLSLQDVEVQRIVNTDLAAALANAAVDAGVVPEPLPTLIENRGIGVRFDVQELVGRQTGSVIAIGPSLLNRPETVTVRFLIAYLRGLREYLASLKEGKVADPQVLEILSKWTRIPVETIAQATASGAPADGRIDLEDLNRQQDFWEREGLVPVKADLSRFVDYRYLEAALAQLR
jgi:NitT/TauT family transport system substrate-binding protein